MTLALYIVDVFAEANYAGNRLAVGGNAADLDSDEMQAIAREMHFSETTFIVSNEPRSAFCRPSYFGHRVRYSE